MQGKVMARHDKAGHKETWQSAMKQGVLVGTSTVSMTRTEQRDAENKDKSNSCKIQESI